MKKFVADRVFGSSRFELRTEDSFAYRHDIVAIVVMSHPGFAIWPVRILHILSLALPVDDERNLGDVVNGKRPSPFLLLFQPLQSGVPIPVELRLRQFHHLIGGLVRETWVTENWNLDTASR